MNHPGPIGTPWPEPSRDRAPKPVTLCLANLLGEATTQVIEEGEGPWPLAASPGAVGERRSNLRLAFPQVKMRVNPFFSWCSMRNMPLGQPWMNSLGPRQTGRVLA